MLLLEKWHCFSGFYLLTSQEKDQGRVCYWGSFKIFCIWNWKISLQEMEAAFWKASFKVITWAAGALHPPAWFCKQGWPLTLHSVGSEANKAAPEASNSHRCDCRTDGYSLAAIFARVWHTPLRGLWSSFTFLHVQSTQGDWKKKISLSHGNRGKHWKHSAFQ